MAAGFWSRLPWTRRKPSKPAVALEWAARAGYAARGFVYLSIGGLAASSAIELARTPTGAKGAIAALAEWPLGQVWAALIAIGLIGFALWRGVQAVFDADRQGSDPKGLASRAGQAISGLVYGALAWSILELLDELEDYGEADETESAQQGAAQLLSLPFGGWLLLIVGVFVLAVGVAGVVQAFRTDFGKRLGCKAGTRRWACWVGRIGYGMRGLAFLPLGLILVRAGWDARASEVRNLGGALQSLEAQPFGSAVLFVTGLGLAAFGLYAVLEALWRRIDPPDPV
ncbi:DUF1206 domain-containing protein [Caulobacter sp. NIBR1757]|uniref:DUF1206 domain-containing protein n=1 Tax=Caulobacter sp. NIBR1757 TaxID=3016000 RepID=UPI0022F08D81|nr:DUF1206 domain-containing protein [Caulobacter sp. NIBR1757]WGM40582.1 hypothetical protein AMEJIAPC_03527 [Caulobacter sp. NIBR1757]